MRRGSTPQHSFRCPYAAKDLAEIRVIYAQDKQPVVVKTKEDCELDGTALFVRLTQEDTLKFMAGRPVEVQIRLLFRDGSSISSNIITMGVERLLEDEVMK